MNANDTKIAAALRTAWTSGARTLDEAIALAVASGIPAADVNAYVDAGIAEVLALG